MRFKGYQYGRTMIWKEVARTHLELLSEIKERKPLENIQEVAIKYHKYLMNYPK